MEDIEPALESLHENAAYPALTGNEANCVLQLIRVVPPAFRSLIEG
ncbi:hypothetical protein ABXS75_04500 [Roseburia hominis]